MQHRYAPLAIASTIACLAGCPEYNIMHAARPIAIGTNQFGVGAFVTGFSVFGNDTARPGMQFQFRRGVYEDFDFGLRYSTTQPFGITADFNYALVDREGFVLSIDPTVTPLYVKSGDTSYFLLTFMAPVLMDVVTTESLTLTVGAIGGLLFGTGRVVDLEDDLLVADGLYFGGGGTIGAKVPLGDTFTVMPTVSMLYWFGPSDHSSSDIFAWTGGVGFLF